MKMIESLKKQTKEFKKDYLASVKDSINEEYVNLYVSYYGNNEKLRTDLKKEFNVDYWNCRKAHSKYDYIMNVLSYYRDSDINKLVDKELAKYSKTFDAKLERVATKLQGVGFTENAKIKLSYVSNELAGSITEKGLQTYSFYSIIAYGEIQRPHYRFLIKKLKK